MWIGVFIYFISLGQGRTKVAEKGTGGNEEREHCPGRTFWLAWLLVAGPGSSSRGAQQLLGEATWTRLPWQPVSLVTRGGRSKRSSNTEDELMLPSVCREVMLGWGEAA